MTGEAITNVLCASSPQPFWHRGLVSWKTIYPWMGKRGMGEDGLGVIRVYYIYCALYFLLLLFSSTSDHQALGVENPSLCHVLMYLNRLVTSSLGARPAGIRFFKELSVMELEGGKGKFVVGNIVKEKLLVRISFPPLPQPPHHIKIQGTKPGGRVREEEESFRCGCFSGPCLLPQRPESFRGSLL